MITLDATNKPSESASVTLTKDGWPVKQKGYLVIEDHCEDGHWSGYASSRSGGNIAWDTEALAITVHGKSHNSPSNLQTESVSQKRRKEFDKEKIEKMPRKELNSEVMHCWREQQEQAERIAELERENAEWCSKALDVENHPVVIQLKQDRDAARKEVDQLRAKLERATAALERYKGRTVTFLKGGGGRLNFNGTSDGPGLPFFEGETWCEGDVASDALAEIGKDTKEVGNEGL